MFIGAARRHRLKPIDNAGLCVSQLGREGDLAVPGSESPRDVFCGLVYAAVASADSFAEMIAQGRA
jgi:hypothetical protein